MNPIDMNPIDMNPIDMNPIDMNPIDITKDFSNYVQYYLPDTYEKHKLISGLQFISSNNISIILNYNYDKGNYNIQLIKIDSQEEIGEFNINQNNITSSLGIHIDEDLESGLYRGKGLARILIGASVFSIIVKNPNYRSDKLLFIDTDASAGFWKTIGMSENKYYDRNKEEMEGKGYEMKITFSDLSMWALGIPAGSTTSMEYGGRKKSFRKKTYRKKHTKKLRYTKYKKTTRHRIKY